MDNIWTRNSSRVSSLAAKIHLSWPAKPKSSKKSIDFLWKSDKKPKKMCRINSDRRVILFFCFCFVSCAVTTLFGVKIMASGTLVTCVARAQSVMIQADQVTAIKSHAPMNKAPRFTSAALDPATF